MDIAVFMHYFESFQHFNDNLEGLLHSKGLSFELALIGEKVATVAVLQHHEVVLLSYITKTITLDYLLLAHQVGVLQRLHCFNLLLDVLLKEGTFPYMHLRDALHCPERLL